MLGNMCRVSAPDGSKWGAQMSESVASPQAWKDAVTVTKSGRHFTYGVLGKGGIGLIAGHGLVWEHIVNQGEPFGVVMEDDVSKVHPDTVTFLGDLQSNKSLQEGWDFLLLQSNNNPVGPGPRSISFHHQSNTAMYVIKLDAARKMLKLSFPLKAGSVQLDGGNGLLWTNLRGAVVRPALADASHGVTDVQQRSFLRTTGFTPPTHIEDCPGLDAAHMVVPSLDSLAT